MNTKTKITELVSLFFPTQSENVAEEILDLINEAKDSILPTPSQAGERPLYSESDIWLISYGDTLSEPDKKPLQTLTQFLRSHLREAISQVHLLPIYPYTSDDGFAVADFTQIRPDLGSWKDIDELATSHSVTLDFPLNHISASHTWFQGFLAEQKPYKNIAITESPDTDLSLVTRPRTSPLLSEYLKTSGEETYVWTTFSRDQIDLNYRDRFVFVESIKTILLYLSHGMSCVRLDAITYLWKEIGTTCVHLPPNHAYVQLLRLIFEELELHALLLTETNVPHTENISYFGDGTNEAHLVYNFTLPPLLAYALHTGDGEHLTRWAKTLSTPSNNCQFFNFTASHDGIGLRPVEGILTDKEKTSLIRHTKRMGGQLSLKNNPDGSESVYELNITYLDLMNDIHLPQELWMRKFLTSQLIMLAFPGVPAVYIHSLLGTQNWHEGYRQTKHNRTLNRQPLQLPEILPKLQDSTSLRGHIFQQYRKYLNIRASHTAFHPQGDWEILDIHPSVFGIQRSHKGENIICISNLSDTSITLPDIYGGSDLLSKTEHYYPIELGEYQTVWLT